MYYLHPPPTEGEHGKWTLRGSKEGQDILTSWGGHYIDNKILFESSEERGETSVGTWSTRQRTY